MLKVSPKLLVQLYQQPELALQYSDLQWQSIILVLRHQQLLPRYAKRIQSIGVFEQISTYAHHHFTNGLILAERQRQQIVFEAMKLSPDIRKRSDYAIYLKGAAYVLADHPVGDGRICSDIDILVDKSALQNIEQDLCFEGWFTEEINDYDDKYYREWTHEIPPLQHHLRGTVIDVHHNIVPLVSGKAPDVGILITQIRETESGHQVLNTAAMTLHSAVHLFFNEDFKNGFRDLLDLHILMSESSEEYWKTLLSLAFESGFELELFLACRNAKRCWNTSIPSDVYKELSLKFPSEHKLSDFIFERVLLPHHPLCSPDYSNLAAFLAWCRGHHKKMPMHVLFYHFSVKGTRLIAEKLFGKHFFTKQNNMIR
jgi:hypothetical protein